MKNDNFKREKMIIIFKWKKEKNIDENKNLEKKSQFNYKKYILKTTWNTKKTHENSERTF